MANLVVNTNQLSSLMTNCYTVFNTETREAIIIDPASNGSFLVNNLKNQGLKLKAILLTHGHMDHIGGVAAIKAEVEDVKVYASKEEREILQSVSANLSAMFGQATTVKADVELLDGDTLDLLSTTIHCYLVPGHTKGGMCYHIPESQMVFSGDTLFAGSIGRSDFPTGDEQALLKGIEEKLFVLPDETVVYPGHNSKTTIKREKALNPFFGDY